MLKDESGFGTIEVIILLAIVVGIALLFRTQITKFSTSIIDSIEEIDFTVQSDDEAQFWIEEFEIDYVS